MQKFALTAVYLAFLGLSACGGGGDSPSVNPPVVSGVTYVPGVYMPSAQFKDQCAAPRGTGYPDRPGTAMAEKLWLRSWTNETYLWYSEVQDTNPSPYSVLGYFDQLKTTQTTPSGRPKDRFHFAYDTAVWDALAQGGEEAGYGIEWALLKSSVPRNVVVAYTHPGSPASSAIVPVRRGERVLAVDSINIDTATSDQLNAAFWPSNINETHTFTLRSADNTSTRTVSLTSKNVTLYSVLNTKLLSTSMGPVGYMQFNDHLAQSELALWNAITTLKNSTLNGVKLNGLIVDIRYNGGGYVAIASELAYMIAGPTRTSGQTFELTRFNDKYPNTNPITGRPITPTPFYTSAQNFSVPTGTALPTLGLDTVYVLTGPDTCSASESLINGLRGVGVQVVQIGSTTCGKPYGFYAQDNCGTTYFSIQLRTTNAAGFGDYADGFAPANGNVTGLAPQAQLPGCSVADDFLHDLGDPLEGRLAAARNHIETGACPVATGFSPNHMMIQSAVPNAEIQSGQLRGKSILREIRWE